MLVYIIRRVALMVFVLWGVSLAAFLISHALPADPAAAALGNNAREEQLTAFRERNGLDRPLAVQYGLYMTELVRGDLGSSLRTQNPITADLRQFFPATLELTLGAVVFAVLIGVPLGIVAALTQGRAPDLLARTFALLGGATPVYWLAILALNVFHEKLGWLPGPGRLDAYSLPPPVKTGLVTIDALLVNDREVFVDALRHLILPGLVLGMFSAALLTRMTRSALLEVLSQDYIRTARAKGLTRARVVARHAMRNASLPILTVLGTLFGSLLTGAVLTETIFSWPGIGGYATTSAISLDFPAVMGVTLVAGLAYSVVNLLVDLLYAVFDPRISYS
ncbi:peptide/nickel transport system permease protein [Deinococcus metalli]|uniref:Peptide ABC transporter permease n=1 Tax=Deinococcus metalli TaxID=1141878 RepID=A0A7W8KHP0_9DEIO|nr:ABC transporter permease [Deinococcus metalli]MBB5378356.1 peptide/nickel transport system permease protein [Deinococcus metalli]GHF59485.1 peptide ABC transporter permease [Deinococcus metalli]